MYYWHVVLHSGAHLSSLPNLTSRSHGCLACPSVCQFVMAVWFVCLSVASTSIIVHSLSAHFCPCRWKSQSRRATVPPWSPWRTAPPSNAGQNLHKLHNFANRTDFSLKNNFWDSLSLAWVFLHKSCEYPGMTYTKINPQTCWFHRTIWILDMSSYKGETMWRTS